MDIEILMVRDGQRLDKRLFTVNERILLHLKESGSASQSIDLPAPMTQEGIANALEIRVNHVSRAVKGLQKQGCIREATARVKGEIRKKKIYLITEDGMAVANNVIGKIGETVVSVRDSRQRLRETSASDAKRLLMPPRTYTAMLASLDERGVLDIFKEKTKRKKAAAVSRFVGASPEKAFHGREEELKKVRAWLQVKKPPILALTGQRGIGKTALAMRAVRELEGKRPVFWYTFTPGSNVEKMVKALSALLHELGKVDFVIEENEDVEDLRKKLEASLIGLGALFILDGVPEDQGDEEEIVRVVTHAASATGNQVLLTARELQPWKRELRSQDLLEEMRVHGLDEDSCRKLAPDLDEKEFVKAFRLARGNPFEIKLLSEHAEDEAGAEELTPEERALLRYIRIVHESNVR